MIALGSNQVLTSEKCKGNEILITTAYTRKNIVLSRYLFFYLSFFTIMTSSFFISIFVSPLFNYYIMVEDLLITCMGISIITFFTFKINNNLVYNVVTLISVSPILAIMNTFEMINYLITPYIFCIFLFLLSITTTAITFKLSKKIYINKNF